METSSLDKYNWGINTIGHWLQLIGVQFSIATNHHLHRSIRFRHKGIEYEVNGAVRPNKVARLKEKPFILNLSQATLPMPDDFVEVEYVDGPLYFGVWAIGDGTELFLNKSALAVVEFIQFNLREGEHD